MNADKPHYTDAEKIKRLTAWREADKKELAAQADTIAQLREVATAAREVVEKLTKRNPDTWDEVAVMYGTYKTDATVADVRKLAAALAALEQETK